MAFAMLRDAMKECSGNKLLRFPRTESAQNTYTHEGISSTTHSGLQPASTRVQRYQQGCTPKPHSTTTCGMTDL